MHTPATHQDPQRIQSPLSRASAETVPAGDVGSSTHLRGTRDLGTVGALQATIVDSMAEGVALISSVDGTILYTNAGFDAMLGYERDELLNVAASVVSPPGDDSGREGIVLEIAEALEHERVWQGEVENRRKDGTTIWCLVSVTPLPLENDEPVWVAVHTDISKRRRADREQARVHEATVEASKTMSGFVANLSHEIRTPLNGVIGMTRLLGDSTLDSVQREYVDALAISGEALLSVIGDVLDFSKIEAGRMALDPTDFDLRDAVEESCLMLAEQAHRKGLQINHWVDVDVPTVVRADRARLRQILLNLLNNAVKFTASGEVLLRVSGHESALLEFAVEDTGVGIENIQASSLFDPFVQADPTTTREYGGTGLGLAIARQLVRCMGGEIGARPREGGGSVFWFTVDMPRGEELVTDIRSAEELQGLRVLAVDPNQTNLTVLEHYLSSWGIDCHTCAGALQALDALEEASDAGRPFDLAILDLDMPEMDGLELARAIRGRPDLRELRLLLLGDSGVDVEGYPEAGISSALTKPAHQSALRAAISEATARSAGRPAPPRPAQSDPVDRGLQVLVVEDNQVNSTIACALLAKSGLQSVLAGNGREAVEMARTHELAAILMDCQMPELDGFEASREIRKAENGHRVPIIAMTALTMPGDRERCIAAGMDDYLTKPLRVAELRSSIQRWIPAECSEEPLYDASDPRAVADVTVSGDHDATLDSTTLAELRRTLSAAVRMQLMDTFEAQAKRSVEEIATAAARGDNGALRRAAHLLKGSAASLGATRLQQGCQRAEHTGRDGDREVGEEELRELGALVAEACVALRERFV